MRSLARSFSVTVLGLLPLAASADNCDTLATKLVETDNSLSFVRRSTVLPTLYFTAPFADGELDLDCTAPTASVSLASTAYPKRAFWTHAAALGSVVTGIQSARIESVMRSCYKKALSGDEIAEVSAPGLKVECQAFTRDGGGSSFTIYKP